jgi:hypothetical protein
MESIHERGKKKWEVPKRGPSCQQFSSGATAFGPWGSPPPPAPSPLGSSRSLPCLGVASEVSEKGGEGWGPEYAPEVPTS